MNGNLGIDSLLISNEGRVELKIADVKVTRSGGIQKSGAIHANKIQKHSRCRWRIEGGPIAIDANLDGIMRL